MRILKKELPALKYFILIFFIIHLLVPAIQYFTADKSAFMIALWTKFFPLAAIAVTIFYTYKQDFNFLYLFIQPLLFFISTLIYAPPVRYDQISESTITLMPFMYAFFYLICTVLTATASLYFFKFIKK